MEVRKLLFLIIRTNLPYEPTHYFNKNFGMEKLYKLFKLNKMNIMFQSQI